MATMNGCEQMAREIFPDISERGQQAFAMALYRWANEPGKLTPERLERLAQEVIDKLP